MTQEKKVKDLMAPITDYETIDVDAPLCDVMIRLKKHYDQCMPHSAARFNKSIFVTDEEHIVGKLSMYHFIRALVPETSKTMELRALNTLFSSRVQQVSEDVSEIQERFAWLHQSFFDLVKTESRKSIRECMAPAHAVLKEDDTINWAIYSMFKLHVRELLVTRNGKAIGVLNFTHLFAEMMNIVGPDCDAIIKDVYAS